MAFLEQFRVRPGAKVNLGEYATGFTAEFAKKDKGKVRAPVKKNIRRLGELQYLIQAIREKLARHA